MSTTKDRFRINGPSSYAPQLPATSATIGSTPTTTAKRDRAPAEARPLFTRTGLLSRASGSAYIEAGRTRVVATVMGPRQARRRQLAAESAASGRLTVEFKFATFASPVRRGWMRDTQEKEYSIIIQDALLPSVRVEQYPHSVIDVFVRVLEADGDSAALATGITAACMALADARVELCDIVLAASAGTTAENATLLLDCDAASEKTLASKLVVAYQPNLAQITQLAVDGEIAPKLLSQGVDLCVAAAGKLLPVIKETLADKFA